MQVVKAINPNDFNEDYILIDSNFNVVVPVKKYLNFLKATGKSPNTIKNYCFHLKNYFYFLEQNNIMYNSVDTNTLVSFIQWLRKPIRSMQVDFLYQENSVCNQTINTIIAAISSGSVTIN